MTEWRELKTLQDVAAAQAAGDEIEHNYDPKDQPWEQWNGTAWYGDNAYRARPRKNTKTVVLREALFFDSEFGLFETRTLGYTEHIKRICPTFIRWLDTPERVVEVEE